MAVVLIAFCLLSIPPLFQQTSRLFLLDESEHGDSYILYDVLQFQKTGIIYRDLQQPPYVPVQYSPLVYALYSVPGRFVIRENPFLGPRLIVIAAFLLCIGIASSTTHALLPVRFVWAWGILLPFSISSMWNWVLQIRGDFPGIFFSLLTIRLLMSRSRWSIFLAGLCAGLATQFKFTFVAAAVAGTLWLLAQRRWKELGKFVAMAAVFSIGLYLLYFIREPRMLPQILALSPGVKNLSGDILFGLQAANEPVFLLALAGMSLFIFAASSRWALLFMYTALSFAIAALMDLQAGGNINYFFEGLFAVIPFAVLGVLRLMSLGRRKAALGLFVLGLFGIHYLVPRAQWSYYHIKDVGESAEVNRDNQTFRNLERVLRDRHIFSTVPRLALLDPRPAMMEPYLVSYLHRLGKFDPGFIIETVQNGEYDVVVTTPKPLEWRGIPFIEPALHNAIAASYSPYCTIHGWLFHLPAQPQPAGAALARDLAGIGCLPVSLSIQQGW